jgi:hypothetical protein
VLHRNYISRSFYGIKSVQENQEGLKHKAAYQFPVNSNDDKLLGEIKRTMKEKAEAV